MALRIRLATFTLLALVGTGGFAHAGPITVAEFRWDAIVEPPIPCPPEDPICVPEDAFVESVFSLTNLWDGPDPAVTLVASELSLAGGDTLTFFDLPLFGFDQIAVSGAPVFASIATSFQFDGQLTTLVATLNAADTFAVLRFTPPDAGVPEPGTLALAASGLILLVRRRRA